MFIKSLILLFPYIKLILVTSFKLDNCLKSSMFILFKDSDFKFIQFSIPSSVVILGKLLIAVSPMLNSLNLEKILSLLNLLLIGHLPLTLYNEKSLLFFIWMLVVFHYDHVLALVHFLVLYTSTLIYYFYIEKILFK